MKGIDYSYYYHTYLVPYRYDKQNTQFDVRVSRHYHTKAVERSGHKYECRKQTNQTTHRKGIHTTHREKRKLAVDYNTFNLVAYGFL